MPSPGGAKLRRGRIIWADVADHNGFRKCRPAIILTPTDEIHRDEPLIVMAITTTFPDPTPADHVELPWQNGGHPKTHLNRRNAAVVTWFDEVPIDEIVEVGGDVPPRQMRMIDQKLASADDSP